MAWQQAAHRSSAAPPGAAPAPARLLCPRAAPPQQPPRRGCVAARATRDRVLRYPDGVVRYIRYPVQETIDEDVSGPRLEVEQDEAAAAWDVATYPGLRARAAAPRGAPPQQQPRPQPDAPARGGAAGGNGGGGGETAPAGPGMSDTVAFLDGLFGSSFAASQPDIDIEHCYQVLEGCPWLVPRPVYVLTLGDLRPGVPPGARGGAAGSDSGEGLVGSTYTLRTKVVQADAGDALAKLLGKPHLASSLEVARMVDGVVTFETCDAAARYATRVEEEGETQVTVAEVDSHKLFRLASDSSALVVLVAEGANGELPAPFQLAAALKRQRAWDDL